MSTRLEKMTNALKHTEKTMTFQEYADNLVALQKTATQLIMGEKFETGMRLEEAIAHMEYDVRKASLQKEELVKQGMKALRTIEKEARICKAGLGAEREVVRALNYVTRPNTMTYQNVYVTDGQEESELDDIVLTNEGIIILEVKGTKEDITITEDGRLIRGDSGCFGKGTLGEKMISKRKILQHMLEKALEEKGLDIPVVIDSMIVFSAPPKTYIKVEDRYHKEKYCFKSHVAARIDSYAGYAWYTKEQMEQLDVILQEFAAVRKGFEKAVDMMKLCRQFTAAMDVVYGEEKEKTSLWQQWKKWWGRLVDSIGHSFQVTGEKKEIYSTSI